MASSNPYEQAMKKERTAAGLQGAATGASVGATVGSAVYPGIGTLIGAGVGAIGGGIAGSVGYKQDALAKAQMEELAELQRRQELGTLGLTEAERAQLEAELIDPMRTSRREQQLQFQQALQGVDVGAGSFYKMGIGQEQRVAAQEQDARNKIEAANMAAAAADEARIYELLGEEQKRADAMREANMQSLAAAGQIAGQVSGDFAQVAQNDIYAEQENALLQQMQSGTLTAEEQTKAQQDYNFIRLQRTGAY
jgi:outer membrane lipoprotein SlyB